MASVTDLEFLIDGLIEMLVQTAYTRAYPGILQASKTLANGMERKIISDKSGKLVIPYYWAVYLDRGRRNKTKASGAYVWFKNPRDDPRFKNGYPPKKRSDVRNLTSEEWEDIRDRILKARREGVEPGVVITRRHGATTPQGFFSFAQGGKLQGLDKELAKEAGEYVKQRLLQGVRDSTKDRSIRVVLSV